MVQTGDDPAVVVRVWTHVTSEFVIANDDVVADVSHRGRPVGHGSAGALEHFVVVGLRIFDDVEDHGDFD